MLVETVKEWVNELKNHIEKNGKATRKDNEINIKKLGARNRIASI